MFHNDKMEAKFGYESVHQILIDTHTLLCAIILIIQKKCLNLHHVITLSIKVLK